MSNRCSGALRRVLRGPGGLAHAAGSPLPPASALLVAGNKLDAPRRQVGHWGPLKLDVSTNRTLFSCVELCMMKSPAPHVGRRASRASPYRPRPDRGLGHRRCRIAAPPSPLRSRCSEGLPLPETSETGGARDCIPVAPRRAVDVLASREAASSLSVPSTRCGQTAASRIRLCWAALASPPPRRRCSERLPLPATSEAGGRGACIPVTPHRGAGRWAAGSNTVRRLRDPEP
jgi:hypothetical protein